MYLLREREDDRDALAEELRRELVGWDVRLEEESEIFLIFQIVGCLGEDEEPADALWDEYCETSGELDKILERFPSWTRSVRPEDCSADNDSTWITLRRKEV